MLQDENLTDETLMQRYRDGDVDAFERLYARHKAPLYRYFLRLASPAAVAEELFQDVWMNVVRARERYEPRARFGTWLYRLAHNRLVDHYRRRGTAAAFLDVEAPETLEAMADDTLREPEDALQSRRLAQQCVQALERLPEPQREAFLLRAEGGFSLEEIAAATGVGVETAKSRLRYALARLRRELVSTNEARAPSAGERR